MVLLVAATAWEAGAVRRKLPSQTGRSGRRVRLLETGIGATAAQHALSESELDGVTLVVSCGFAGALQPDLRTGDLVADARGLESELVETLRDSIAAAGLKLAFGPIGQADKVLTASDKGKLAGDPSTRLAAIDMETAAVRRWSAERSAPCLALRSVLDELGDEVPQDWPASPGFEDSLKYVFSHLTQLPFLLRTWRKSARASDTLSRGLEAFLEKI